MAVFAICGHCLSIFRQWTSPRHKRHPASFFLAEPQNAVAINVLRAYQNCVRNSRAGPLQHLKNRSCHRSDSVGGSERFTTNTPNSDDKETPIFTLLESGTGFVVKRKPRRLDYCKTILSDWFMAAIESNAVVSISEGYFRLRPPLERRLNEIGRKHCGNQKK